MGIRTRRMRAHSKTHFVGFGLAGVLGFIALLCVTLALSLGAVVSTWLEDLPDYTSADAFLVAEPTRVYDADGNEIVAYYLQNRRSVTLDQVSNYVIRGTIDTEDKRFYQHNGVDPEGIARAAVGQVFGGGEQGGGSTITQQLVRWTVLSDEQFENSLRRKVREAYIAIQMEKTYTKEQILNMYLNTIFYGNGAYGIEAAAITYFNKNASDLTLNEAATLVGIPNSPTYYDPFVNYENCKNRRNLVLSRMLEAGDISQEEYDATIAEEIPLNPGQLTDSESAYPYFTDYVRNLLLQDFSSDTIAQGGLKVFTTLDPTKQQAAERACAERMEAGGNPDVSAALVSIDNSNGHIVAMVGGQNYGNDTEAGQSVINLATSSHQTGSSFKAVVLLAALEDGMSPTVRIDCQSTLQVTPTWAPSNIEHIDYGVISLARATAVSSNTGYVQVAEAIGMDKIADMAARLGIDSQIEPVLSSALGTSELTVVEMCEAFSTIANGGVHRNSVAITRIEDRNGNVVYEHEDDPERVVDSAIVQDATEILETVITEGSATYLKSYYTIDQPVAGKTGTADNYSNLWFCGFTPQLTTAVWVGCPASGSARVYFGGTYGTNATTSIPIWGNYMSAVLAGEPREEFPTSDHKAEYKPDDSWTFIGTSDSANSGGWTSEAEETPEETETTTEQPETDTSTDTRPSEPTTPTVTPGEDTDKPAEETPAPTPDPDPGTGDGTDTTDPSTPGTGDNTGETPPSEGTTQ